jgi:hypothetical protein
MSGETISTWELVVDFLLEKSHIIPGQLSENAHERLSVEQGREASVKVDEVLGAHNLTLTRCADLIVRHPFLRFAWKIPYLIRPEMQLRWRNQSMLAMTQHEIPFSIKMLDLSGGKVYERHFCMGDDGSI